MSDITFDFYSVLLTNAERLAWTPDPGAAPGPPGQFLLPVAVESDTGDAFYWDNTGTPQWRAWPGGAGGTVTHTGALTPNAVVLGNGTDDIKPMGSLGTTTTVLHGNAAGAPTFGAVDLAADVTGNLAVSHLNSGSSASGTTFWRGDGTWATPAGSGGTPGGSSGDIQYNNAGAFGGFTMSGDVTVVPSTGVATLATVTVPKGGTGATSLTSHGVILGRGTSAVVATSAGANGAFLRGAGASADPTWATTPLLTILQRTTNQSIANVTTTDISWNTTPVQDDVSAFSSASPTQVTVPSGYTRVRVTVSSTWATNNTGARGAWLSKNGTIQEGAYIGAQNETPTRFVTGWLTVAAADVLKIQVFQSSAGSLNFVGTGGFFATAPYVQFEWGN